MGLCGLKGQDCGGLLLVGYCGSLAAASPRAAVLSASLVFFFLLNFLCKVPSIYVKISSKSCDTFSGERWGPVVPLLSPRGSPGGVPSDLL